MCFTRSNKKEEFISHVIEPIQSLFNLTFASSLRLRDQRDAWRPYRTSCWLSMAYLRSDSSRWETFNVRNISYHRSTLSISRVVLCRLQRRRFSFEFNLNTHHEIYAILFHERVLHFKHFDLMRSSWVFGFARQDSGHSTAVHITHTLCAVRWEFR